jgi:FKBP-type peptidyl-prolyl cis-trans isomerase 2
LTLADGTEVATTVGEEPFVYTQGSGQLLPALEKVLAEMRENETKKVTLAPKDAHGEADPEAFHEVKRHAVPESVRYVGATFETRDSRGRERAVRVHDVRNDAIILDFNHPLAGQTLTFAIRVIAIDP